MKRENENFDRFEKKRFIDLIRSVYFIWFDKSFNHKYRLNTHTNQFQPTFYSKKIIRRQKKKKKKWHRNERLIGSVFVEDKSAPFVLIIFSRKWVNGCWSVDTIQWILSFIRFIILIRNIYFQSVCILFIVSRSFIVSQSYIVCMTICALYTVHCTIHIHTLLNVMEANERRIKKKKLRRKRNKVLQT